MQQIEEKRVVIKESEERRESVGAVFEKMGNLFMKGGEEEAEQERSDDWS